MKAFNRSGWLWWFLIVAIGVILVDALPAMAAEDAGGWRPTYDLIMRWLNFIILAGLLVKFGRQPLKDFLRGQKEQISRDIDRIEAQRETAAANTLEAQQMVAQSQEKLEEVKARIIAQGERRKLEIIEESRRESRAMLLGAQRKVEGRLLAARNTIRAEIVDAAIELSLKRLPKEITADDQTKLLDAYMETAAAK